MKEQLQETIERALEDLRMAEEKHRKAFEDDLKVIQDRRRAMERALVGVTEEFCATLRAIREAKLGGFKLDP